MKDKLALLLFCITNILNKKRTQVFLAVVWIIALIQIPYFSYWILSGLILLLVQHIDSISSQFFSKKNINFNWFEFIIGLNLFLVLGPLMIPIGIIHYIYVD